MRKTLYLLTVLMAVLVSACTNEEIPIKHDVHFRVNPYTVISQFSGIELMEGALNTVGNDYQLRLRMLIYNSDNILVAQDSVFDSNYKMKHSFNVDLEEGEYTAVFSSDVVMKDKSLEFWHLLGTERLSTTTFKDAGLIGVYRKILGLAVKHFSVNGSLESNIDLESAGALVRVWYHNWNIFTNVEGYRLLSNRFSDEMTINDIGEPAYSIQASNSFQWRVSSVSYTEEDSKRTNVFQYVFLLPMKNVTFQYAWVDNAGTSNYFEGAKKIVTIQSGHAYDFLYNCETKNAVWLDVTDDTVL